MSNVDPLGISQFCSGLGHRSEAAPSKNRLCELVFSSLSRKSCARCPCILDLIEHAGLNLLLDLQISSFLGLWIADQEAVL